MFELDVSLCVLFSNHRSPLKVQCDIYRLFGQADSIIKCEWIEINWEPLYILGERGVVVFPSTTGTKSVCCISSLLWCLNV